MKRREWTYREIDTLKTQFPVMPTKELAAMLGRSFDATSNMAWKLGLKKNHYGVVWTPKMLKLLVDFFPIMFNDPLAAWIGVSKRTLIRKARELGLEKERGFLEHRRKDITELARQSLKKSDKNVSTRFQKGVHSNPSGEFKKGHVESPEVKAKRSESMKLRWKYKKQREELRKHGINL